MRLLMLDIGRDIHSLSGLKLNKNEFLDRMRGSSHPVVLTINGKAELVVQDAESCQRLLESAWNREIHVIMKRFL